MERKNSLKTNFIMNLILQGSAYILPFIMTPYISRILLPEGMGKVSFATSVLSYFSMLALLGVPTYGIRTCAVIANDRDKLSQSFKEIFIITLFMSFISYILLLGGISFIPSLKDNRGLLSVMSITIILNVLNTDWLYKSLEKYTVIAIRSIIIKIISIVAILLLVHLQEDYIIYGFLSVIAAYGVGIWNFLGAKRYVSWKTTKKLNFRHHIKPIIVFFSMTVATTIYTNLDIVMLGGMTNDTITGYYDASIKIKTLLVAAVSSLGAVLLPRVCSYIASDNMTAFKEICRKALHFLILLSVPLIFYFIYFAEPVILLYSGPKFQGAILPMKIIMPSILCIGLTNIIGIQMLVPLGLERQVLYSEIAGAITDLILNAILIPFWGASGAAFGTVVAEIVVLIFQAYSCRDYVLPMLRQINYIKIIVAAFIALGGTFWLIYCNLSDFGIVAISLPLFFIIYIFSLFLTKEKEAYALIATIFQK